MMKKAVKVIAIALLVMLLAVTCVNAADPVSFGSWDVDKSVSGAADNTGAATSINKMIGAVLTVVQVIGVGVAVIMLVVLAIKYIAASPGDKAEIKKHAVVYVVGAVVLFAASGILGIIRNFASNISATPQ